MELALLKDIGDTVATDENGVGGSCPLSLGNIEIENGVSFLLDHVGQAAALLHQFTIDLADLLLVTSCELARVKYHSHLRNAVSERVVDLHPGSSVLKKGLSYFTFECVI